MNDGLNYVRYLPTKKKKTCTKNIASGKPLRTPRGPLGMVAAVLYYFNLNPKATINRVAYENNDY